MVGPSELSDWLIPIVTPGWGQIRHPVRAFHNNRPTASGVQLDCYRRRVEIGFPGGPGPYRGGHDRLELDPWKRTNQMPRRPSLTAPARRVYRPGSVHATYRELRAIGWSEREAGNLAAYLEGIGPVRSGWSIAEVERLLFVRALVSEGRLLP